MNKKIPFDVFWKKYPLHTAMGPAERAWNRLSAKDRRDAYAAIDRYVEHCRQTGIAFKYPDGWLNDRRWTDEYDDAGNEPADKACADDAPSEMELW